jgi:hypothetical protein
MRMAALGDLILQSTDLFVTGRRQLLGQCQRVLGLLLSGPGLGQ